MPADPGGNALAPVTAVKPPPGRATQIVAAIAGVLWAVPLFWLAWYNVMVNHKVDGFTLLVAVLALLPAWVFLGRNFTVTVLGQTVSLNLTPQEASAAAGGAPPPQAAPNANAPLPQGAPNANAPVVAVQRAEPQQQQQPAPIQVDPAMLASTGNVAVDLRNGIVGRIKALAANAGVPVESRSVGGVMGSLTATGTLSPPEAGALNHLVDVGNQVANGARLSAADTEQLVKLQPGVIANLDRKLRPNA